MDISNDNNLERARKRARDFDDEFGDVAPKRRTFDDEFGEDPGWYQPWPASLEPDLGMRTGAIPSEYENSSQAFADSRRSSLALAVALAVPLVVAAVIPLEANYYELEPTMEDQGVVNAEVDSARASSGIRNTDLRARPAHRLQYVMNVHVREFEDIEIGLREALAPYQNSAKVQIYLGMVCMKQSDDVDYVEENGVMRMIETRSSYIWKLRIEQGSELFSNPHHITDRASKQSLFDKITEENLKKAAGSSLKGRSSIEKVIGVYAVKIHIIDTGRPVGAGGLKIPIKYAKNNHIVTLAHKDDQNCFWRAFACFLDSNVRTDRCEKESKKLFREFYDIEKGDVKWKAYKGIGDLEYEQVEQEYQIRINVWKDDEPVDGIQYKLVCVRRSEKDFENSMNLLLYQDKHVMLIHDLDKVAGVFACMGCDNLFSQASDVARHQSVCCGQVQQDVFPKFSNIFEKKENVVIECGKLLELDDVDSLDFVFDFCATFDYEAMMSVNEIAQNGKLVKTATHLPRSVGIHSNVPGFENAKVLVCVDDDMKADGIFDRCYKNAGEMNIALVEYLNKISDAACALMKIKIASVLGFDTFDDVIEKLVSIPSGKTLSKNLIDYVTQLPVLSFNGGKYDINLNKTHSLFSALLGDEEGFDFTIKKANAYMLLTTKKLKLLDQMNYCAAGTSLDSFLKAHKTEKTKFFFPYEWWTSMEKLHQNELPPKEAFWSSLKSCNTLGNTEQEIDNNYLFLQRTWFIEKFESMLDFLIYYNKCDVVPFTEACMKAKKHYQTFGIDSYKDAVSLPGCAMKVFFKMALETDKQLAIVIPATRLTNCLLQKRMSSYLEQDKKRVAKRAEALEKKEKKAKKEGKKEKESLQNEDDELSRQLSRQLDVQTMHSKVIDANYRCLYCACDLSLQNFKKLSFDRIDNDIGHVNSNLVVSCFNCNVSRKIVPFCTFLARSKPKRVHEVHPQIITIDEPNKDVYYSLKKSIAGGPSIIFSRYSKVGVTKITKARYSTEAAWHLKESGELCKPEVDLNDFEFREKGFYLQKGTICLNIVGLDANALYVWAQSQVMPCGKLELFDRFSNHYNADLVAWMKVEGWEKYIIEKPGRERYPESWDAAIESIRVFQDSVNPDFDIERLQKIRGVGKGIASIVLQAPFDTFVFCGMPHGEWLEKCKKIETDVHSGDFFGFVTVDIEVPEELYDKFAFFPPIFVNGDVRNQSDYMEDLREKLNKPVPKENRKLVSVMKATAICLYTPLLKWYLENGLKVTKVYSWIPAIRNAPFKYFTEWVTDSRRAGDAEPCKKPIAEAAKTTGNSAFGGTVMNKSKQTTTKYTTNQGKARKQVADWTFKSLNEIEQKDGGVVYETVNIKKKIMQDTPIQVGCAIFQLAKLRMISFVYEVMYKFLDPMSYQLLEMDTDSLYMALSGSSIEELVKPELLDEFKKIKHEWFMDLTTPESKAFTLRTPGLFKVEATGDEMICLTSKSYILKGKITKSALKGVQAGNNQELITMERYKQALFGDVKNRVQEATNRGFRMWDNKMQTYCMRKDGLSPIYDKRLVQPDGVSTFPLINV
jgi:hypothetical protein